MSSTDDAMKKLKKLYAVSGYMKTYGTDVWISVIVCFFFIYLINRYYLANLLEVIRADWPNQKCNPLVMPFAGFINKPTNESNFEFTANNFSSCVYDIVKYVAQIRVNPFKYVLQIINDIIAEIQDAVNAIRSLYDSLKTVYSDLMHRVYTIIANLVTELMRMIINVKDSMNKTAGVLVNGLYVIFGSFMAMESLFLSILNMITIILIVLVCLLVVQIALAVLLFGGFVTIPLAAVPAAFASVILMPLILGILIPVIIIEVLLVRILKLSVPPPPTLPSCFAGDTLIPLVDGDKEIREIKIGDRLKNGWTVTATFQNSAAEQNLYNLNGVRVTGEHRVYHPASQQWIKVKNHPASIYLPAFNEPFVYCLNTDAKAFVIGDTLFSDWDDIDTTVLAQLQKNCVEPGFLPDGFLDADIHTYLESGFAPETMVQMHDGSELPLCEVKVNDRLANNATVLSVVKLAGHDVKQYKHTFAPDGFFLCGTKNVHIADSNLGTINCMLSESMLSNTEPFLYHLLTDTKFFTANNIQVNDYNYGIDAYLI